MSVVALLLTLASAAVVAVWTWWWRNSELAQVRGMKAISVIMAGNASLAFAIAAITAAPSAWPVTLYVWAVVGVGGWIYLRRV